MTTRRRALSGLTLLAFFTVMGCASRASQAINEAKAVFSSFVYVEGVSFYPQTEYQCGPASLAAVLNYWGKSVSPEEIAEAIFQTAIYAGVPAANVALKVLRGVLREKGLWRED